MKTLHLPDLLLQHPCALPLFSTLARDYPNERFIDCDRALLLLAFEGVDCDQSDVSALFSSCCDAGLGIAQGMTNDVTALAWRVMPTEILKSLKTGEPVTIPVLDTSASAVQAAKCRTKSGALMQRFRLRPDWVVRVALPDDLTVTEAASLCAFIKSLPLPNDHDADPMEDEDSWPAPNKEKRGGNAFDLDEVDFNEEDGADEPDEDEDEDDEELQRVCEEEEAARDAEEARLEKALADEDLVQALDDEDLRCVLSLPGRAFIGTAQASGPDRACVAADQALKMAMRDQPALEGAQGLLVMVSASTGTLTLSESKIAVQTIRQHAAANIQFILETPVDRLLHNVNPCHASTFCLSEHSPVG